MPFGLAPRCSRAPTAIVPNAGLVQEPARQVPRCAAGRRSRRAAPPRRRSRAPWAAAACMANSRPQTADRAGRPGASGLTGSRWARLLHRMNVRRPSWCTPCQHAPWRRRGAAGRGGRSSERTRHSRGRRHRRGRASRGGAAGEGGQQRQGAGGGVAADRRASSGSGPASRPGRRPRWRRNGTPERGRHADPPGPAPARRRRRPPVGRSACSGGGSGWS